MLNEFPTKRTAGTESLSAKSGLRWSAFNAVVRKHLHWVRQYKETWSAGGPWDRRAVVWAGQVLPKDERKHWAKLVRDSPDPLDRIIAIAGPAQDSPSLVRLG